MEEKSPTTILNDCFRLPGQTLMDFKKEIDELKKLPDYTAFVAECATFLGVAVKAA